MITDLPRTTSAQISRELVRMRAAHGISALGRVLTLVVSCSLDEAEAAIAAADAASREHPMRVIVIATRDAGAGDAVPEPPRLDAQVRAGSDTGASEVVVMRAYGPLADDPASLATPLLLPETPIVVWWPGDIDRARLSAGAIASRRVTTAQRNADPLHALQRLAEHYRPGDTDLGWSQITLVRAQLAAALDDAANRAVLSATISGRVRTAATLLLAGWLRHALDVPVTLRPSSRALQLGPNPLDEVRLDLRGSAVVLAFDGDGSRETACLQVPDVPSQQVPLPARSTSECLAEELRSMDPDPLYGAVLTQGVPAVVADNPETLQ